MARKIAVAIHKGGVGKTTTVKNLAAALAGQGHRTLIVDLDEQANATKGLGFEPAELSATLNDLFANPEVDAASVILETSIPGLYLMPAHPNLAQTETGMTIQRADLAAADPIEALKTIISAVEDYYDFIIFDTPPSLKYMTINALAAADELLIPAAASAYSADGLVRTLDAYERAVQTYNPSLRLRGILFTRVKRTNASMAVLDSIKEVYRDQIIPQLIVESTAVDEAEQLNQPVVVYDPDSAAALGYKRVAEVLSYE
jgi:chromosome partitioning protein